MKISFVIPAHNEERYIGPCLQSILDQWNPEFLEIIVVDNASTDKTADAAKAFTHVKVVSEARKGTGWARQAGFLEAKGDLLAYLDADTQLPAGWMAIVKKEFAKNPKLVCLSGPFRYYDLPPFENFLAQSIWWTVVPIAYRIVGYAALGANLVAKRSALAEIGGFDTKIAFHGDDTDTARRLSKIGKVKFMMSFYILGSGRRLMNKGLIKTFWEYGMNYLWSSYKHKPYTKGTQDISR